MKHPDLFPQTLIVELIDGKPMTNSLAVAQHFGKRHDNVLRSIKSLIQRAKNPVRLLNFEESYYMNDQGKNQPLYRLNRDAFFFVANGFTGEEAEEFRWAFLDAFNAMEAQLTAQTQAKARAVDILRPHWQTVLDATRAGASRAQICQRTGWRNPGTVTANRARIRAAGLLTQVIGAKP